MAISLQDLSNSSEILVKILHKIMNGVPGGWRKAIRKCSMKREETAAEVNPTGTKPHTCLYFFLELMLDI